MSGPKPAWRKTWFYRIVFVGMMLTFPACTDFKKDPLSAGGSLCQCS